MDFSLFYFADDSTAPATRGSGPQPAGSRYHLLLEGAKFADRQGFTAVWTPERHFHPFGGLYPNPAVTGAALAAVTERIGIRAGSVVAPLHDPLRIAEEWSVVDNLSDGRAAVSFASGWHPRDFVLRPEAYGARRDSLAETVRSVRRLWRGDEIERTDGEGAPQRVRVYPPPVQSELPCWLTSAGGTETFRLAGALGTGVLTHLLRQDLPSLTANLAVYREAQEARPAGAGPRGRACVMLHAFLGPDREQVHAAVRAPMRAYLASALGLFGGAQRASATGRPLPARKAEELLDLAFERYFSRFGLFGTVEDALETVGRLKEAGADEIACLVDFGMPTDTTLDSLSLLAALRERAAAL
ncbi:MupA/Atu3671 family FMN-dependent luciferase-like monooxygenase [Streptomyces sp. NPDC026589]|uniref:MupA/Atu3671 family FMN-dependent luciferase-like monooxygenase n=1 Tax=Streptomyces sp. NPDC026589 TaxID=3155609 RepID=UPI0033DFF124